MDLAAFISPVILLILVLAPSPLCSQTSAHCSFNQLCSCKYAPNGSSTGVYSTTTTTTSRSTFQGQFGSITERYDSNNNKMDALSLHYDLHLQLQPVHLGQDFQSQAGAQQPQHPRGQLHWSPILPHSR